MTAQARDTGTAGKQTRRSDAGILQITQRDIDGFVLCAEHQGLPYDLLGSALRTSDHAVTRLVHRWWTIGFAASSGPVWEQGQAWWQSERRIRTGRPRNATGHVPDAEIHWPSIAGSPYAGQVWAIEVELTPKRVARTTGIMTELLSSTRYASVVYLTSPGGDQRRGGSWRRRSGAAGDQGPAGERVRTGVGAVSVLSWVKVAVCLWLLRKAVKVVKWLLIVAVAVTAWPITAVAVIGYAAAWLRGWPPARLWRAAGLVAADDRRLLHRARPAAAGPGPQFRASPGERLGRFAVAAAQPLMRSCARGLLAGPGCSTGRACDRGGVWWAWRIYAVTTGLAGADRLRTGLVRRTPVAPPGPVRPRPRRRPRYSPPAHQPRGW